MIFFATVKWASLMLALSAAGASADAATELHVRVAVRWVSCAIPATRQQTVQQEAGAIWQRAGVVLDWIPTSEWRNGDLEIVIADELPVPAPGTVGTPMGMTLFDPDGAPGSRLYVSALAALNAAETQRLNRAFMLGLPHKVVTEAAVRLVGRAMAHEIGHFMLGPGHTDAGLMRPSFAAQDGMTFGPAGYGLTREERLRVRERIAERSALVLMQPAATLARAESLAAATLGSANAGTTGPAVDQKHRSVSAPTASVCRLPGHAE